MTPAPWSLFAIALLVLLGSGCTELEEKLKARSRAAQTDKMKTAMAAPRPKQAFWVDDDAKGPPKIVINLTEQRAYFFKGEKVVGESNISTGRKGFETPPGSYRVIQKDEDHSSNLYGHYSDAEGNIVQKDVDVTKDPMPDGTAFVGAKMPYFLRFTRGYGMHAGFVPRYRASHGCIRMPREMAKRFFDAAAMETPVIVEE